MLSRGVGIGQGWRRRSSKLQVRADALMAARARASMSFLVCDVLLPV